MTTTTQTKTKRVALRAGRPLVPVRPEHLARLRAESRRRKKAQSPRRFILEILDEALDYGLGVVVPIKRGQQQPTNEGTQ